MIDRLAHALYPLARATLAEVPLQDRVEAMAAVRAFVASPSPSSWLRATRLLREARRAQRRADVTSRLAERSRARGLERLRALPFLEPATAEVLAGLPADPRAGLRLSALAALLGAHDELAARVRQADASRPQLLPRGGLPAAAPPPRTRPRTTAYHRARRRKKP